MIVISRRRFASSPRLRPNRIHLTAFFTTQSSDIGSTGECTARAIAFKEHGDPKFALFCFDYILPALEEGQVRVKFELSTVNPADINVIQGVYPANPAQSASLRSPDGTLLSSVTIVGNEGSAIVEGTRGTKFKVGDRVVMGKSQLSTWQSRTNLPADSLHLLPAIPVISAVAAATISINPLTAYRLLSDFVPLTVSSSVTLDRPIVSSGTLDRPQQWVIQNAANSAVGEAVIQMAKLFRVKTINLVRDRDDIDFLKSHLSSLGADIVMTYSEFLQRHSRSIIKEMIKGGELRLALNCVGGNETTEMAKLLTDGYLVTYGGMAKKALSVPPSLFIFKNLTLSGFWLSNYVDSHPVEKMEMIEQVVKMIAEGQLLPPATEIVELSGTTEEATVSLRQVMHRLEQGRHKKFLFKFP